MKTKLLTLTCALLTGVVSLSPALRADSKEHATVSKDSSVKGHDKEFFEKAAHCGHKEVSVSQAVLPHLSHAKVKAYAEEMIADHTLANAELKLIATTKGVTLPDEDIKLKQKWSEKTKNVDENYLEEMISDHKNAVELFEKAKKSQDLDIAAFASKTLPKLQHHLESAKELKKSLK